LNAEKKLVKKRREIMFIYMVLLGAVLVITYLVQLLAYGYSRNKLSTTEISRIVSIPLNEELECQPAEI
jgi:hypothetical protein